MDRRRLPLLLALALLLCSGAANAATVTISGTVFEDIQYGGGAGRPLATAGVATVNAVRMELFDAGGIFRQTVNTAGAGAYSFTVNTPGTYTIRAANLTVASTRTGACAAGTCIPVQTFRTNGAGGAVTDHVGGEVPEVSDAGSAATINTTTLLSLTTAGVATPQSIVSVTVAGVNVANVDFGFNFDTIVNVNNAGQGSLRQWITNSNTKTGEAGLAQVGQTAGRETSIFMIPNAIANPGQNTGYVNKLTVGGANGGAARVLLSAVLPTITGTNSSLDGRTQTANVRATVGGAETNPGSVGTGGTVGTSLIALAAFNRTEVVINAAGTQVLASGGTDIIRSITVENGAISVSGASSEVRDCLVGMNADGTVTTVYGGAYGITIGAGANITISHNYVKVNNSNIRGDSPGANAIIEYNEVDSLTGAPGGGQTNTFDGILIITAATNVTVRYNLLKDQAGGGLEFGFGAGAVTGTATENTVTSNGFTSAGVPSTEGVGVAFYSLAAGTSITFSNNIVSNNGGPGIVVERGLAVPAAGIVITQNSVFGNGTAAGLGIDLDTRDGTDPNTYMPAQGVTINDNGDGDAGPNNLLNFPVIQTASIVGANLIVTGWARPASVIEFFVAAADSTGFGEGQTYKFTATEGTADADATASLYGPAAINGLLQGTDNTNRFSFTLATPAGIAHGTVLTATARLGGQTSEFSGNVTVVRYPTFTATKTSAVFSDPVNAGANPKRIPGALVDYTVTLSNAGGPADSNLTFVFDTLPANVKLYVGDLGLPGSGPIVFTNGTTSSGLTYTFTALNDGADDVDFSSDPGPAFTYGYNPTVGADGCDSAVTALRINPKGVFVQDLATPDPSFTVRFRVCVR